MTIFATVKAVTNSGSFRARKAILTLTPPAVSRIKELQQKDPNNRFIKIGVKNRGCSGMVYSLDYIDKKGKLDEQVDQDGATVLIDSKAVFTIIGSEMDYVEDKLSAQFVFKNPNVDGTCGCGMSFSVQQVSNSVPLPTPKDGGDKT